VIQIALLGGLRLLVDGEPYRFTALPKSTPLLAYLLLHTTAPVARDQIAYTLWPDGGEGQARSNLRRHLHDLRRALPPPPDTQPWLLIDHDTIQWNLAAGAWIDVVAFERASAEPGQLADAVALYTGDLLPNLYEDWIFGHRERLRTLFLADLAQLMQREHNAQEHGSAIGWAQKLLHHEPLREDIVRQLMILRYEAGDRAGALQEYQRFAQRLREALEVPPMLETSALYDAIARQLVPPGAPTTPAISDLPALAVQRPVTSAEMRPPLSLPAQLTTFIGREREVAAVKTLLTTPGAPVRLLTLTGAGGCGKTRLALEVAARLHQEDPNPFPEGYFFVSLADVRDAGLIASAIASALDIRESNDATVLTSLTEHLRTRRLLLILDNFEQVVGGAPLLADLLSAAPHVAIIVTSRAVLRLYGEHEYPVAPLPTPDPSQLPALDVLTRYDAIALFTTRSRAVNPNFVLNHENAVTVVAICRQLDGLPLAIELAAARSKVLTPAALLDRLTGALSTRLAFLVDRNRGITERHQTLRSTLEWSYDLLTVAEQTLFQQVAIFAGSFSYEAAEAICGASCERDVLTGLETLVDNSLLDRVESELPAPSGHEELRFHTLSIIRDYALEQLEHSPAATAVRRRHAAYYLALAQQAEPKLEGSEQVLWLKRLDVERENWRAALRWLLADDPQDAVTALDLAASLGPFWLMYGYWAEGHRWLERALAHAVDAPAALRAKALFFLGSIVHAQGDLRSAPPLFAQSLALYRQADDPRGCADALYGLGRLANRKGRYAEAEALLLEGLTLARQSNHSYRSGYLLNILAYVQFIEHGFAQAEETYQQALATMRANGDLAGLAFVLTAVGELARQQGDYAQATLYYNEAMDLAQTLNQNARTMMSLHNLAYVALNQGDVPRAGRFFRQSLKLGLELPDKENVGMCLVGLGCVAVIGGASERALRLFGAGTHLLEQLGAQLAPADQAEFDRYLAQVQTQVEEGAFTRLTQAGRQLSYEQATALALSH
jgi:predicted ATPase/DNA-binding SARP family transcriptional activator